MSEHERLGERKEEEGEKNEREREIALSSGKSSRTDFYLRSSWEKEGEERTNNSCSFLFFCLLSSTTFIFNRWQGQTILPPSPSIFFFKQGNEKVKENSNGTITHKTQIFLLSLSHQIILIYLWTLMTFVDISTWKVSE